LRDVAKNPFAERLCLFPPATIKSASIFCAARISSPATHPVGCSGLAHCGGYAVPSEVSGHIIDRRVRRRFVAPTKYFNYRYGHDLTDQWQ
jgi:hypothetical protein